MLSKDCRAPHSISYESVLKFLNQLLLAEDRNSWSVLWSQGTVPEVVLVEAVLEECLVG